MMILHKTVRATVTKGLAPRQFRFEISNEHVDRDGDQIFLDAWDLRAYKTNPVVLAFHDTKSLPVGRSVDIGVAGTSLQAVVEFPPEGLYAVSDTVHNLVAAGFLKAASVGFTADRTERNEHGGYNIRQASLCEWSIVPIGSNPSCLLQKAAPSMPMQKWLKSSQRHDPEPFITIIDSLTPHKEDRTMSRPFLTLKDDTLANPAGDQSANLVEVAATLLEQARAIDATFRTLGINASIADIVRQMMRPEAVGTGTRDAAVVASERRYIERSAALNERVARGEAETRAKALAAELLMRLQTPPSKIYAPGYSKVYGG